MGEALNLPDAEGWYTFSQYCDPSLSWAGIMSRPKRLYVMNLHGLLFVEGQGAVQAMARGHWEPSSARREG